MAENTPTQANEEIDLGVLFDKIKSFFKSILIGIVQIVQFFWKHKWRLIIVGVLGIAVGLYFAKTTEKIYLNELLVQPNYNSTQYVYDKVYAIDNKIKSGDSIFLNTVFGEKYKKVKGLEIEPIMNVYALVSQSEEIQETFKMLYIENGDSSFFEEEVNKISYENHKIKLLVKGIESNKELTESFYKFLNNNEFYNTQKLIFTDNYSEKLQENKFMRNQIDSVIKSVQDNSIPKLSQKGLSFSGSQDVTELIKKKEDLYNNDLYIKTSLANKNKVVTLINMSTAIMDRSYNFSFKIVPFLFVGFYCFIFLFLYLRRKVITLL